MDVVNELRSKIKKSNGIKNFGIGFDVNKLIVLLNDFKVDIAQRDQDIRILRARILCYKAALCDAYCKESQADGNCDRSCSKFNPKTRSTWCSGVKNRVTGQISHTEFDDEESDLSKELEPGDFESREEEESKSDD